MPAKPMTDEELANGLLEVELGATTMVALASRLGVSPSTLRRHRRRIGRKWPSSVDEWVRAALGVNGPLTQQQIVEWVDWRNHVRLSDHELGDAIARLVAAGATELRGDRIVLRGRWP